MKSTVFLKYFNTIVYNHTLRCERRHCCHYCLHTFVTEEVLKHYIKDYFKINSKQTIKTSQIGEYVQFKNFKVKIKSSFMIYANFERILVPEDYGKQNSNESYTNKY